MVIDLAFSGCGGLYTASVGSLQSPGHPSGYPHGVTCTYQVAVDPEFIVSLQFLAFGLQSSDNCADDFVEIFDGSDSQAASMGR